VLVINGDARTVSREDEAYFLELALKASDRSTTVMTALPDDVAPGALSNYNVVFLANVADPSVALAGALTRFVNAGGGLFLSVGSKVDTTVWNERLALLLPQPLSLTRTAAALPGQAAGETVDDRPAARLLPLDRRHPMLATFPARGEGIASARFFKFLLLEPVPDTAGASVILRYETGAPALVEKTVGQGAGDAAQHDNRPRVDRPAHPRRLPAADSRGGPATGGDLRARRRLGAGGGPAPGDLAGPRGASPGDHQARRQRLGRHERSRHRQDGQLHRDRRARHLPGARRRGRRRTGAPAGRRLRGEHRPVRVRSRPPATESAPRSPPHRHPRQGAAEAPGRAVARHRRAADHARCCSSPP
jgi:hypothetical protein